MKANFPIEYMTAILTAESGDVEKIAEIIKESERMGIPVLPPNINESFGGFTIVKEKTDNGETIEKIRFGLYTIKNLGVDISDAIIEERKKSGKFLSITNFLERVNHKNLNKKSLEALIKSGSMDEFGKRWDLFSSIEDLLLYNKELLNSNANQGSLFGNLSSAPTLKLKKGEEIKKEEMLRWEKELLGLYISGHPLEKWKDKIQNHNMNIKKVKAMMSNGMQVTFAGIIETVKPIITKKNEQMAFVKIADLEDSIETVVFPSIFKDNKDIFINDTCVALSGKVSVRNDEKTIIIEKIKALV